MGQVATSMGSETTPSRRPAGFLIVRLFVDNILSYAGSGGGGNKASGSWGHAFMVRVDSSGMG